jgi:hypothetical protein
MAGPKPDRPLLAASFHQVEVHQARCSGYSCLPAQFGGRGGGEAQAVALGHGGGADLAMPGVIELKPSWQGAIR